MRDPVKDIWAGPSCYSGPSLLFPESGRVDKVDLGIQRWTESSFSFGGSLSFSLPLFFSFSLPGHIIFHSFPPPHCIGGNGWRVTTSHCLTTLYSSHMRAQIALVCECITLPSSYGLGLHMLETSQPGKKNNNWLSNT